MQCDCAINQTKTTNAINNEPEFEEEGVRSEEAKVTPDKERTKKIPVVIPYIKGPQNKLVGVLRDTASQY